MHTVQYACSRLTGFTTHTRRNSLRSTSASMGTKPGCRCRKLTSVFRSLAIFGGVSWKWVVTKRTLHDEQANHILMIFAFSLSCGSVTKTIYLYR